MAAMHVSLGESLRTREPRRPAEADAETPAREAEDRSLVHEADDADALDESVGGSASTLRALHEAGGNGAVYEATRGGELAEQGPDGEDMMEGEDGGTAPAPSGGGSGSGGGATPAPAQAASPGTVTVATSASTMTLMDNASLTASATGTATTWKFEIRRAADTAWHTLQDGAQNSFRGTARLAGNFRVRASAGTVRSAEVALTVQFPTYSTIVGNGTVGAACDAAWAETKAATTATSRREQAFWVRLDTSNGNYSTTATIIGPSCGPTDGASVQPGARPADTPASPTFTNASAVYTVACFHTHTPMTYRYTDGSRTRPVGPSGADVTFHNHASKRIPGIVYDYSADARGGHDINLPARLYHCGPDRRDTPA